MVASMPACATLLRYFLVQSGFLSSIGSRLASSRNKRYQKPKGTVGSADNTDSEGNHLTPGGDEGGKTTMGLFWRLRNPFGRDAPQITSAKRESGHILRTGDFNVFKTKITSNRGEDGFARGNTAQPDADHILKSVAFNVSSTKTSAERCEASFDQEKAAAANDVV